MGRPCESDIEIRRSLRFTSGRPQQRQAVLEQRADHVDPTLRERAATCHEHERAGRVTDRRTSYAKHTREPLTEFRARSIGHLIRRWHLAEVSHDDFRLGGVHTRQRGERPHSVIGTPPDRHGGPHITGEGARDDRERFIGSTGTEDGTGDVGDLLQRAHLPRQTISFVEAGQHTRELTGDGCQHAGTFFERGAIRLDLEEPQGLLAADEREERRSPPACDRREVEM
jgi:hypothetical protein